MDRVLLVLACLAVGLTACSEEPAAGPTADGCTTSTDCTGESAGQLCIESACTACAATSECEQVYGAGSVCGVGGACETSCAPGTDGCPCDGGTCGAGLECDSATDTCGAPVCPDGSEGCACFGNGTCDTGLTCDAGTCVAEAPCEDGALGCACYGNGSCDAPYVCDGSDTCVEDSCVEGAAGCACKSDGTCDADLTCGTGSTCEACVWGTDGCPCGSGCATGFECTGDVCVAEGCTEGTEGCPCDPEGDCDSGFKCAQSLCEACTDGAEDCPCNSDLTCDDGFRCDKEASPEECVACEDGKEQCPCDAGTCETTALTCEAGVCEPVTCPAGTVGCACDNGTCAGDALCNASSLCASCDPDVLGCPCTDGSCTDSVCDAGTSTCRASTACADAGCVTNQKCQAETATADAACLDECETGFVWNSGTNACDPETTGGPCDAGSTGAQDCEAQSKVCNVDGAGYLCGACITDFGPDGSGGCTACTWGAEGCPCASDGTCTGGNLACTAGTCVDTTCTPGDLGCPCDTGDACNQGLFCNTGTSICGDCPVGGAACNCGATGAWNKTSGECVDCSGVTCPTGGGTTGLYASDVNGAGKCFCETEPGWFPGENETSYFECDADGDGWVRENAWAAVNSTNDAVRANARCTIRSVDRFLLKPELGAGVVVKLSAPYELYEPERNDDQVRLNTDAGSATTDPNHLPALSAGRTAKAEELNGLTKACVDADKGDYNTNKIPDVEEHQADDPVPNLSLPGGSGLEAVYRTAAKFSYFIELHRGYYLAAADAADCQDPAGESLTDGCYVIKEKGRQGAAAGEQLAVTYGSAGGAGDYWQVCDRYTDSAFATESATPITMDFAQHALDVMTHHSQFKCVHIVADTPPAASALFQKEDGAVGDDYVLNACTFGAGSDGPLDGANNPSDPQVTCVETAAAVNGNQLVWAAAKYQDYLEETTIPAGLWPPGLGDAYVRGCINECEDVARAQASCGSQWEVPRWVCEGKRDGFGEAQCGCGYNYGGYDKDGALSCHIGCPGSTPLLAHDGPNYLFYSDDFNIATRQGIWMCGATSTVSYTDPATPHLSGTGTIDGVTGTITVRGEIPRDGTTADVLKSGSECDAPPYTGCITVRGGAR